MTTELLTAEGLERLNMPNKRTELVRGRLVVREPAGYRHGVIAARIAYLIGNFIEGKDLGVVVAAETGFTLARNPDTVRAPDAGFVSKARNPRPTPRGFPAMAPDLAVEVLSPDDRAGEILAKTADWLNGGAQLVWLIDPDRRVARVYRADGTESLLTDTDSLDGERLLAGFTMPLSSLFSLVEP